MKLQELVVGKLYVCNYSKAIYAESAIYTASLKPIANPTIGGINAGTPFMFLGIASVQSSRFYVKVLTPKYQGYVMYDDCYGSTLDFQELKEV